MAKKHTAKDAGLRGEQGLRDSLAPLVRRQGIKHTARVAGLDAMTVSRWLRGEKTVEVRTLVRIAEAVGANLVLVPPRVLPPERPRGRPPKAD